MLSLDLSTTFENNKTPINGSGLGPNADHESSTIRSTAVTVGYVVSPRLSVTMSVPHREIHSPKDVGGAAAKHIDRSFSGLGDAIVLGRYRLDTNVRGPQWHGLLGLRLPTGSANPNHNWIAADGSTVLSRDPVLQPGFGTLDPIIGLQWMRPQPRGRAFYAGTLWRPSVMLNRYGYKWAMSCRPLSAPRYRSAKSLLSYPSSSGSSPAATATTSRFREGSKASC